MCTNKSCIRRNTTLVSSTPSLLTPRLDSMETSTSTTTKSWILLSSHATQSSSSSSSVKALSSAKEAAAVQKTKLVVAVGRPSTPPLAPPSSSTFTLTLPCPRCINHHSSSHPPSRASASLSLPSLSQPSSTASSPHLLTPPNGTVVTGMGKEGVHVDTPRPELEVSSTSSYFGRY